MRRALERYLIVAGMLAAASCAEPAAPAPAGQADDRFHVETSPLDISIASLSSLTVETLRARKYGSTLTIGKQLGDRAGGTEYSTAYGGSGPGPYDTFMASYESDGLRLYSRIDVPNRTAPKDGFPVIIFCHGWVGIDAAPTFHFSYTPESMYAELIDGYVDAGFVVLTPGYRGHGTVDNNQADGIEFMAAWDNGSYVSPIFYAIDVLNLLEGLPSLEDVDFGAFPDAAHRLRLDLDRVNISGHSQGGDVALIVLAAAGEGSGVKIEIAGASISDGTFPDRFTQVETFAPMQKTPEAFMSGDGTWTGTKTGASGANNPNFVFGYPPDWIGTVNREEWTWQNETWSTPTVAEAIRSKYEEMYATLNAFVGDIDDASFSVHVKDGPRYKVTHDVRVVEAMASLGAFGKAQFLEEPLILHFSDQDFYSLAAWNEDLCARINGGGGNCRSFLYSGNNHLMRVSEHKWFSPEGTLDSYRTIIDRDVALFSGEDPEAIAFP